jgi:hypothetical protein
MAKRKTPPSMAIAPGEGTRLPTSLSKANLTARREEFLQENADLLESYEGFHIKAWMDMTGAIRLSVGFPHRTSGRKLNKAWTSCLSTWAARAEAFNDKTRGGNPPADWPYPLRRWMERESWGKDYQGSYADVADSLNREIMEELHSAFCCAELYDAEEMELSGGPDPLGLWHRSHAQDVMTLLNVSPQKQAEYIDRARTRLLRGKPAFDTNHTSPYGRKLPAPRLNGPITWVAVKGFLQANRSKS